MDIGNDVVESIFNSKKKRGDMRTKNKPIRF